MFILKNKQTGNVFFGKDNMMIICKSERAAEDAACELEREMNIPIEFEEVDESKTVGLVILRYEDGQPYYTVPGGTVAFKSDWDAWQHSGSIWHRTSEIVVPKAFSSHQA